MQVLASGENPKQGRYLSKNNNNILRLKTIKKAFPNAIIIIPFRNPIQQAISLSQQHIKFVEMNLTEPFIGQYMSWLGHFEFGPVHRPYWFGKERAYLNAKIGKNDFNYWLAIWVNTYQFLLKSAPSDSIFVSALPKLTIGSIVKNIPSSKRAPSPQLP